MLIQEMINLNDFHIFNYKKYSGFKRQRYHLKKNSKILCLGSCDIQSIRPVNIDIFSWVDYLSLNHEISCLDKIIDYDILIKFINFYISNYNVPEILCYTMSIISKTVIINDMLYTLSENSSKTIHFMFLKKIINTEQKNNLLDIVNDLSKMSDNEKIEICSKTINSINTKCLNNNIKFYFTTNGTKTANKYFHFIIDEIIKNSNCSKSYIGWINNIDTQVDSSMGIETQKEMYKFYNKKIC